MGVMTPSDFYLITHARKKNLSNHEVEKYAGKRVASFASYLKLEKKKHRTVKLHSLVEDVQTIFVQ